MYMQILQTTGYVENIWKQLLPDGLVPLFHNTPQSSESKSQPPILHVSP